MGRSKALAPFNGDNSGAAAGHRFGVDRGVYRSYVPTLTLDPLCRIVEENATHRWLMTESVQMPWRSATGRHLLDLYLADWYRRALKLEEWAVSVNRAVDYFRVVTASFAESGHPHHAEYDRLVTELSKYPEFATRLTKPPGRPACRWDDRHPECPVTTITLPGPYEAGPVINVKVRARQLAVPGWDELGYRLYFVPADARSNLALMVLHAYALLRDGGDEGVGRLAPYPQRVAIARAMRRSKQDNEQEERWEPQTLLRQTFKELDGTTPHNDRTTEDDAFLDMMMQMVYDLNLFQHRNISNSDDFMEGRHGEGSASERGDLASSNREGRAHRAEIEIAARWRRSEPFTPWMLDDAFGQEAEALTHGLFGPGFAWELGSSDQAAPVRLELFPKRRVAALRFVDDFSEPQTRNYPLDGITVYRTADGPVVALTAPRRARWAALTLKPDGGFQEHGSSEALDQFFQNTGNARSMLARHVDGSFKVGEESAPRLTRTLGDRPLLTVVEAAEQLGYHYTYVKKLIRNERLPAVQLGRNWYVDARAVEQYRRPDARKAD